LAIDNTVIYYKNCYKVKIGTEDGLRILNKDCGVEVSTTLYSERQQRGGPPAVAHVDLGIHLPGSATSIYRIGVSDLAAQAFVECLGDDVQSIERDQEVLANNLISSAFDGKHTSQAFQQFYYIPQ
jgi:hypothetical protein